MSKLKRVFQAFVLVVAFLSLSVFNVQAKEDQNKTLIVSDQSLFISPTSLTTFTAATLDGTDATKLQWIIADPGVATVTPIAYSGNVAAFGVNFVSSGNTVLAIFNIDNPEIVEYIQILSNPLEFTYPERLGTNPFNYCSIINYRFAAINNTAPENAKYKYSMIVNFKCMSFEDITNSDWNCMGTFFDVNGNAISKVNLHSSKLAKDKCFAGEVKVPVNAVRLELQGF